MTSELLTILLMFLLALLTSFLSKIVINLHKLNYYTDELRKWNELKEKAIKKRDMKLLRKVKREEVRMNRLKTETSKEMVKVYVITIPIWIVSYKLLEFLWSSKNLLVFPLLPSLRLNFFYWYLLNSFWVFSLANKIIGVPFSFTGTSLRK